MFFLVFAACSDNALNRRIETDTFYQAPSNEVDILWVVDNSKSMEQEQARVASGAELFIANLESTGMDFHLGVITTDMDASNPDAGALLGNPPVLSAASADYVGAFAARVQVATGGSDQEKGLQAALTAVTPPLVNTRNTGFLRDEAMLSIIIVSDENDCSDFGALGAGAVGEDCYTRYDELTPVQDIVAELEAIKDEAGRVTVSGIVGPEKIDNCEDTVAGRRYYTAIAMTGGLQNDICTADYARIMDDLGLIATGMLSSFPLDYVPDPETIEVQVQPAEGEAYPVYPDPVNGWVYVDDDTAPRVDFFGAGVPPRGSMVAITYEVATSIQAAEDSGAP